MKYIEKYWILIIAIFFISFFINPVICMLLMGLLIFTMSIRALLILNRIEKQGTQGIGRILAYQVDGDGDKNPIVEFTATNGENIKAQPYIYSYTDLNKIRSYKSKIDTEV
jgi:hypothetical protein